MDRGANELKPPGSNGGGDAAVAIGGYTIDIAPEAQGSAAAFWCCRGPAYLWQLIVSTFTCCGCLVWDALESIICCGLCFNRCKPLAEEWSDADIADLFTAVYPFTQLVSNAATPFPTGPPTPASSESQLGLGRLPSNMAITHYSDLWLVDTRLV